MVVQRSGTVADLIADEVAKGMLTLPCGLCYWVQAHLVTPRPIVLCLCREGCDTQTFWLVTDHVGADDAPCRVVFDGKAFGLAMKLEDGRECFIGPPTGFSEAVQNI